ncbi:type IV pilus assembly protein PilO [Deinococcus reticulitermitis]|uniref:Type IV pilus assembly protein PilO n=1 Tax=Deinococcus reticulitermitis TaxID=856736 RepID=A0A1H6X1J7_9DEIO|nr:type 4a pilus biogenesis protein PilO [Deinococcus reticulitermitis]SEJ23011.1 type IV pilus assembly protein PilO [Deinococcus reticulitermitis]
MKGKLTPQHLFLLTLLGSLLLGYLVYLTMIQPRQQAINALGEEISLRQLTRAQYQAAASQIPALRSEVGRLEQEREQFLRALPTTANFAQVVDDLRRTIEAAGGELVNLSFTSGSDAKGAALPAGVKPIGMTLDVGGQYAELFQVLRSLELQRRFTTVDSVSLQAPAEDAGTPNLSGTLGLTVYVFDAAQATGSAAAGATPDAGTPAPAAPESGGTQ